MVRVLKCNTKGELMCYFHWKTELLKDLIPWFYVITLKGKEFGFLLLNL
jgi:hypothetical protein